MQYGCPSGWQVTADPRHSIEIPEQRCDKGLVINAVLADLNGTIRH